MRVPELAWIGLVVLLVAAALTGMIRRISWAHGLLDVPNARSSHLRATPRGGGLSIVIALSVASLFMKWSGVVSSDLLLALLGGGGAVAVVGFLDDRHRMPAGIRLAVHVAAGCWALFCLGGLGPLAVGRHLVDLGWAGQALALLAIVWALNLFNFMDGIDGIAASEAVFIVGGAAGLSVLRGQSLPAIEPIFCAACLGFLLWNWPPARIFMGDVGSGYLGYTIAVIALAATHGDPTAVWVWLILGGVFFIDATLTLVRRALRRERLHEAHRSHAYQWLARRWGSHRRVTLGVLALNLVWLLPCAAIAALYPAEAIWVALGALLPLAVAALAAGSGRRESHESRQS